MWWKPRGNLSEVISGGSYGLDSLHPGPLKEKNRLGSTELKALKEIHRRGLDCAHTDTVDREMALPKKNLTQLSLRA